MDRAIPLLLLIKRTTHVSPLIGGLYQAQLSASTVSSFFGTLHVTVYSNP